MLVSQATYAHEKFAEGEIKRNIFVRFITSRNKRTKSRQRLE
jgi:hypothetical protein